jgi:hypothetical protein
MTKTLSMVSHKNYNLNDKWGFCHFSTSKLITCFIDCFTPKRKSQSIAYLLNGSEHIYWIWDLENEVHSIWVIWTSNLQECKDHAKVGQTEALGFSVLPPPARSDACNARRGYFESPNKHTDCISPQHNKHIGCILPNDKLDNFLNIYTYI